MTSYNDLIRNSICPSKCWQTYSAIDCRQLTCQYKWNWPFSCCVASNVVMWLSLTNDNRRCHATPKLRLWWCRRYLWPFILEKARDPFSRKLNKLLPLETFVCIPSEMQTCLPAVAQQLFQDIRKVYEETSQSKTRAGKWRRYDRLAV